ncbi:Crp/Fnr family transcriptional regulator [Haloglycomyces albus]|uniref:Crp/Fnr family transcriptional regulator n=1 Tax=Haloglycomyces albus TaxID=526067 RepID=UPI001B7F99C0|nr:Crp/Fnr family transcriptional regulator [Haloglycomyces albus]
MSGPHASQYLTEVDIFRDLSKDDLDAIAAAAPMRTYDAGEILYTPYKRAERLYILKRGRIRIFRVAPDGRALTTAMIDPGTIFGEMTILGQQMYDNFAEALDESIVCTMNRDDVTGFLLSDVRIATRIAETLGHRLAATEQRLSDSVFKNVPQRIAGTLCTLVEQQDRKPTVHLTHEQLGALVGTSRETTTKVLGEFAESGWIKLGRAKITVVDEASLVRFAGN